LAKRIAPLLILVMQPVNSLAVKLGTALQSKFVSLWCPITLLVMRAVHRVKPVRVALLEAKREAKTEFDPLMLLV
jgi:hypothetical protein